jgi:hypothetical protein
MPTPDWTRPFLKPRLRRAVPIIAALSGGLAFAIGMTVGSQSPPRVLVPLITPVYVTLPPPPAPVVVTPPARPPTPAPAAPVEPPPQPRAIAPHLAAHCLLAPENDTSDPACAWDDGFPAISADGALIATKYFLRDNGDHPGVSIHFIDVKTGRLVRDAQVLLPGEYNPEPAVLAKLRVTIYERATAIQRTLDARLFRSLIALGKPNGSDTSGGEVHANTTKIYAEVAGGAMRIVDPATATVLAQSAFFAPPPVTEPVATTASQPDNPDALCSAMGMRWFIVWWDPATKVAYGLSDYQTGGCMCPDKQEEDVYRMH